MDDEEDDLSGLSEEILQFADNTANSSKANVIEWALKSIEEGAHRFSWSQDEMIFVMSLINQARNQAAADFGQSTLEQFRMLKETSQVCPSCGRAYENP